LNTTDAKNCSLIPWQWLATCSVHEYQVIKSPSFCPKVKMYRPSVPMKLHDAVQPCEVKSRCQPVMNWLNDPNETKTSGYLVGMSIYNIVGQQKVLLCKGRCHSFQTLLILFRKLSNLNKELVLSDRATHQYKSSKPSLVVALPYTHPNQTKQPYTYPSQAKQLCTNPLGTPIGTIIFYLVATGISRTFDDKSAWTMKQLRLISGRFLGTAKWSPERKRTVQPDYEEKLWSGGVHLRTNWFQLR